MGSKTNRLYFIDAIRAWAILMMLQGHFIDGLLDLDYRDNSNFLYATWQYFRGITAPIFFTASGFIFTYLLVKGDKVGLENPRVKKGLKRGLQLLFIGYLLRINLMGLLVGEIYPTFYVVDVLHCIGLSILGIVGFYLFSKKYKNNYLFPSLLLGVTCLLFLFEPYYSGLAHSYLPQFMANYFTKTNGSVFTIFPWFGYASFGGFISFLFHKYKNYKNLYPVAITSAIATGLILIFLSSPIFLKIAQITGIQLFADIFFNNYLFIRLGDVLVVFGIFMLLRRFMTHSKILIIGQSTLSIYIIHFIILYGSFTGLGIYQYLHHTLNPYFVIFGAILFIITTTYFALQYEKNKANIKLVVTTTIKQFVIKAEPWYVFSLKLFKSYFLKAKLILLKLFRLVKN